MIEGTITYEDSIRASLPYRELMHRIGRTADRLGIAVYMVGGMVRDALLKRPTTDLDFVTVGSRTGIRLAQKLADELNAGMAHVYPKFGTAAIRLEDSDGEELVLEFVGARRESYRAHSRKPIVEEGTLEDDQRRRDFTVNTLAVALNESRRGRLIDPFDGLEDLRLKRLRTPLDPHDTFEDDPLRMMRAARFAAQLGFSIDEEVFVAMREKAPRMEIVSQERITDELGKIVTSSQPSVGFRLLYRAHLLREIMPELENLAGVEVVRGQAHKDNFFHTLHVVDNLASMTADRPEGEAEWLRWAAVLHDIAKPKTKRFSEDEGWTFHGHEDYGAQMVEEIFRQLKLPLDERMQYVRRLVRLHHRPVALVDEEVTDSAVRRLLFEAGDDIDDLMMLVRADITSKNPHRVWRYLERFDQVEAKMRMVEEKDRIRNFQPPIDGYEIMQTLDLEPGPVVGEIKDAIKDAILEGVIPNEYEAAYRYMMDIKDEFVDRRLVSRKE